MLSQESTVTKPIRVLMVVRLFFPWVGGTEGQAYRLAKELLKKNVSVQIVTGWWFRGTPQHETMDGIPIFRNQTLWEMFGVRGLRKFGGYLYIASLLWHLWRQRDNYDVLHVHGLNYHAAATVLAGRRLHRKTIVKLANSGQASDIRKMEAGQQLPLSRYLLPTALRSDRFVATSGAIAQELVAAGVQAEKIVNLPNGVEVASITAKSDYALHEPARLIFVGRLHEQKGLDTLLAAYQRLLARLPDRQVRLRLLGDGPLRAELVRLAASLGVTEQIEFMGTTPEVYGYLLQSDIFVLPSRAEGHSNALLEAMACGLPVLASDIQANAEVVGVGRSGLTFAVGDPESLARNLARLLDEPDLRERLGRAARQVATDCYGMSAVADRYVALYREILGQLDEPRQP